MILADCALNWPQAVVYVAEWIAVAWIFGGALVTVTHRSKEDK